jgi:hypothetical protein
LATAWFTFATEAGRDQTLQAPEIQTTAGSTGVQHAHPADNAPRPQDRIVFVKLEARVALACAAQPVSLSLHAGTRAGDEGSHGNNT